MNLTIGQRISTRGEDFIITNSNANFDGSWLLEAEGISELVKGKRFSFDSNIEYCRQLYNILELITNLIFLSVKSS